MTPVLRDEWVWLVEILPKYQWFAWVEGRGKAPCSVRESEDVRAYVLSRQKCGVWGRRRGVVGVGRGVAVGAHFGAGRRRSPRVGGQTLQRAD